MIGLPGGGGYGPPDQRDPAAIQRDVLNQLYTPANAERLYGAREAVSVS